MDWEATKGVTGNMGDRREGFAELPLKVEEPNPGSENALAVAGTYSLVRVASLL